IHPVRFLRYAAAFCVMLTQTAIVCTTDPKVEEAVRGVTIEHAIVRQQIILKQAVWRVVEDENCTIPLQERLGVRVNIPYSDGSNALRMYPAGRKFRVGEQVNPWWETRRPYTRIYYLDSLGKPALAWDFAFPFVGVIAGARSSL